MSVACAAEARGQVYICGLCCQTCGGHGSADGKGQGSFLCCGTDDYGFIDEKAMCRRILKQHPPKVNNLDRKSLKGALNNCDKDVEM